MRIMLATRNWILSVLLLSVFPLCAAGIAADLPELQVPERAPPIQSPAEISPALSADADDSIGIRRIQTTFGTLDGRGLSCVIIDSGINAGHQDFAQNRLRKQLNLTTENHGNKDDAADTFGHGTHVAGIIAADGVHQGIARAADLIAVKILTKPGTPQLESSHDRLLKALIWIKQAKETQSDLNISVVNISVADGVLYKSDEFARDDVRRRIRKAIQDLRGLRVPVVVSAGNHYGRQNPSSRPKPFQYGMEFPAIIRETISVGAIYSNPNVKRIHDSYEVSSFGIVRFQITPFSARLFQSRETGQFCRTDLFAPGGDLYPSTGMGTNDSSNYPEGGTSQAAPIVTGAILLLQQFWFQEMQEFPTVDQLEEWLREGGTEIWDGDDEYDDIRHTCGQFRVLNVYNSLTQASKAIPTPVVAP